MIGISAQADGGVLISWQAQAGKTYHLQYKNDIDQTFWRNLPGDVIADGNVAAKLDQTLPTTTQRFYRVEELPHAPPPLP
ncbi:MAG: hypothetical protein HY043_03440 [Verrucomicrobia bacterium]|nr:hypothetical protein [Verrucomicrobiota bacterium]